MPSQYRLISADGHVVEPPDMWTKYLPEEVPRPGPEAGEGREGRRRLGARPRHPAHAARPRHQRRSPTASATRTSSGSGRPTTPSCRAPSRARPGSRSRTSTASTPRSSSPPSAPWAPSWPRRTTTTTWPGWRPTTPGCTTSSWRPTPSASSAWPRCPASTSTTSVKWLRDAKAAGYKGVIISAYPSGQRRRSPTRTTPSGKRPKRSRCPSTSTAGCARPASATAGSFQKAAASAGRSHRPGRDGRAGR